MLIREEGPEDVDDIARVEREAFGRDAEALLVERLRSAGAVTLSLVAFGDDGVLVGHALFSPVVLRTSAEQRPALGLGPLAVSPACQRQGIGSRLVEQGLQQLRDAGHDLVFVLGDPAYYPRLGFVPASGFGIRWEHAGQTDAFMLIELRPQAARGHSGVVCYRPEFSQ